MVLVNFAAQSGEEAADWHLATPLHISEPRTNDERSYSMTSHEKQQRIDRRDDVNPKEGEHKYGEVEFADPVNNKYPVDTPEHVRAAWSYIHHKDNASKYDAEEVRQIKSRIKRAAKKHGVEIEEDS
jgi:hypothetical protein